jgi:phage shock protein PspC (stress-responsive transcriptional regulator)
MNTSASDNESNISAGAATPAESGTSAGSGGLASSGTAADSGTSSSGASSSGATGPVFDKPSAAAGPGSGSAAGAGTNNGGQQSGPGSATGSGTFFGGYGGSFGSRELRRPINDRMLAGVAAGIADYLGVDATIVRIVLAVLVFAGGAGVPIYLAGWLLIPEEGADASIASELVSSLENRSR